MSVRNYQSQQRLISGAGSTKSAFAITNGRTATITYSNGRLRLGDDAYRGDFIRGARGLTFGFFATGNSGTLDFRLWLLEGAFSVRQINPSFHKLIAAEKKLWGGGTLTVAGGLTGASTSDVVKSTEYLADGVTSVALASSSTSPPGFGDARQSAYQLGDFKYSVDGTNHLLPATINVPDLGPGVFGWIMEMITSDLTAVNCYYNPTE